MAFVPDPQQRKAIEHIDGPMLVIAGAGTGKTTVLVQRIVHLVARAHVRPDEILAVTFTDNAAGELQQRVKRELGAKAAGLRASTFHSYCFELLQQTGNAFRPLDRVDLFVYLRRRLSELPLQRFIKAATPGQFLQDLLTFFDRCEDELVTASDYAAYVRRLAKGESPLPRMTQSKHAGELPPQEVLARCQEVAAVFSKVVELLEADNLGPFGQMIGRAVRLLEHDHALLAEARRHARFLLIDEFQDSNVAQIRLARLLGGDAQNVFAVGDPDQAIYRFRGATTGAFDQFERHFSGVKRVRLQKNRRSLSPILQCAFHVIDQNPPVMSHDARPRRQLISAREEALRDAGKLIFTDPVEIVRTSNAPEEAADVAASAAAARRHCPGHQDPRSKRLRACRWADFAILYRQHTHRDALVRELTAREVPFHVKGVDVADSPEVRDALAALTAIATPADAISLFRLAALPQFAIDGARLRESLAAAREGSMVSILQQLRGGKQLLQVLSRLAGTALAGSLSASQVLDLALRAFDIPHQVAPIAALRKFLSDWENKPITKTGKLEEFLEYLDYFLEAGGSINAIENDDSADGVQLMTVHAAKGLEFAHVFVIRAASGSFPAAFREALFEFPQALRDPLTSNEGDPRQVYAEEERRLFYVAMTRACDTLSLSGKRGRGRDPNPPGYLRGLARDRSLAEVLRVRDSESAQPPATGTAAPVSRVASWLELPVRAGMDSLTLSVSRMETYETCPLRFKIETDWRLPGEPFPAMHFGNAVHTTLRAYYDALRVGRPLSREALLQCFSDALSEMRFEDDLQRVLFERQGKNQLGRFYDLHRDESVPEVIATEQAFQLQMGGVRVRGRIDRADRTPQGIVITDYKTGSPRTQEDADESLQLSIYALAAKQLWGAEACRLLFYNLETNATVESARTPEQLREVEMKVDSVAAAICAGQFDARRGYWCNRCPHRQICPATEERLFALPAAASA